MLRRRPIRIAFKLIVALAVGFLILEGGLRFALFTDNALANRIGRKLRSPELYSRRWEDEYWKLQHLFAGPEHRLPPPRYDSRVGWVSGRVEPETYTHKDEKKARGKRPVLLYGDSFAGCVLPDDECWQGVLERSDLAGAYSLLNYGVGGYGMDQAFLLFKESIGRFAARDPVVILGILVDDDLDRSSLSFRGWPKPRLSVDETGSLSLATEVREDADEFLAEHPVGIRSYVWRYLVYGSHALPQSFRDRIQARADRFAGTRQVCGRILREFQSELVARGLDGFVALFHGRQYIASDHTDWRERFLATELERIGLPWVSSRARLKDDLSGTGRSEDEYFIARGKGRGHYTLLGNEVVFGALRAGLEGIFDGAQPPVALDSPSETGAAPDGFARFETARFPPFEGGDDSPRLLFKVGAGSPSFVSYRLGGSVRALRATLKRVPLPPHLPAPGRTGLKVIGDGAVLFEQVLSDGDGPVAVDVALEGVELLTIVADESDDGATSDLVYLASPKLLPAD